MRSIRVEEGQEVEFGGVRPITRLRLRLANIGKPKLVKDEMLDCGCRLMVYKHRKHVVAFIHPHSSSNT